MKAHDHINIFRNIVFTVFISISLLSCQEVIELNLHNSDVERLVIEGRITDVNQPQYIRLTESQSYFANQLAPVASAAEVLLIPQSSNESIPFNLIDFDYGIFSSDTMHGQIGELYTFRIDYKGESYEAELLLDTVPDIDSVSYYYQLESFFGFLYGTYNFKFSFFEPPPSGDYYRIDVYLNDTLYTKELADPIYFSDFQRDNQYWYEQEFSFAIPQEHIKLDTNLLRFELFAMSEDEYDFIFAFIMEAYASGSLFTGPPANIPSNLKNITGGNDAMGYISASARRSIELVLFKEHDESTNNPDIPPN